MPHERHTAATAPDRRAALDRSDSARPAGANDVPPRPAATAVPRFVVLELDGDGRLDNHAAMCLRLTIEDLLADGASEIVLDVRDLTSVDPEALGLLRELHRACSAEGAQLGLLIDSRNAHGTVAHDLEHAGLRVSPQLASQQLTRPARSRRRSPTMKPRPAGPVTGEA